MGSPGQKEARRLEMAGLDVIQENYVFRDLSTAQLQKIVSIAQEKTYRAGQTIFKEGDHAGDLYILQEGKVLLEMRIAPYPERTPTPSAVIDVITKGELFGWSALVPPHVFTLSAHTADKCQVVTFDGGKLTEMMDSDPVMGYEIVKRLSKIISTRLKRSREMLMSERGLALLSQAYSY